MVDVVEVQRSYHKAYGRQTSNLLELYDYFKKHCQKREKREKSTKIIASL